MIRKMLWNFAKREEIKRKEKIIEKCKRIEYKGDIYYIKLEYEYYDEDRAYVHCCLYTNDTKNIIRRCYNGNLSEIDAATQIIEEYREKESKEKEIQKNSDLFHNDETLVIK